MVLSHGAALYACDHGSIAEDALMIERQLRRGLLRIMLAWLLTTVTTMAAQAQGVDELTALGAEATQLYRQGKYADGISVAERALALAERLYGRDHIDVAHSLNNLATLYDVQGRHAEAEAAYRRALTISEKALGPDHPDLGTALNNLAVLYRAQGRYSEAEPLYKRSLAIAEKSLGPDHPLVSTSLNNVAALYESQGRYADAEPLYKRSLAIAERALGPDHPDVGAPLNNLAGLYRDQGRYAEAEQLYSRSLAIAEKALGPEHPNFATALNNLAVLYWDQGRYAEAEPLSRRSLAIVEKVLGPYHPDVAASLNALAQLYRDQGRAAEAKQLFERSLATGENALGPDHPFVATVLNNLASLLQDEGSYSAAEPLFKRSLALREKALGPDHPLVGTSLNNLAGLHFVQHHWSLATDYWRRSAVVVVRRTQRGIAGGRGDPSAEEAQRLAGQFWGLVKVSHRLAVERPNTIAVLASEMFETAQWAQGSEAAASLAQMAARSAKGSPQLAGLVRERQDLVSEWQTKDKQLIAAKSEPPPKRKAEVEKALADRLAAIDIRLADIDQRLGEHFPDYAALASPAPASVAEIQAQLRADEALVLFLDTPEWKPLPEETFVWVITRSDTRWTRSDLGTEALTREVGALRCGLDGTAWDGDGTEECAKALSIPLDKVPGPNQLLPFDHARAYELYWALFGKVQDLIKGKHLLVVPSGPLTQLPFHVLVTKPPTSTDHRAAAWLAREHAVTVLPAVSSLKALRRVGKPSTAPRPMIGFGNPLLDGRGSHDAQRAKLAREHQSCPVPSQQRVASSPKQRGGVAPVPSPGGLADPTHLKAQAPLPETTEELCAVARSLKADLNELRLGARATEQEVKALSSTGVLAQYRIVHFATHGALAGQLTGTSEAGLILTPPERATSEDDGYLSASEVTNLRLDADLVVLSACNTAAGGATNAEALSGLARAFFYAQARALLVTHWAVDSDATVKLITSAVREIARDANVGRAEGLRRAMLALIDKGAPHEAHPAYWAPFIVVGEGAAH
jgi:CHAT domain-containing protein/tetratricopeptide (TPR) repeat protein